VLIFKNGLLTDAYYANIVCLIDQNLLTPTKPLLKGVMRAYLLDHKRIETANINRALLQRSKGVFLINALNPLRTSPFVPIEKIYF
jgi:4-amino-4-deoxychorismate lyase